MINLDSLELLGKFTAIAAEDKTKRTIRMCVYIVNEYRGNLTPSSEIEENAWVASDTALPLGSIFQHDVIPALVEQNLID